MKRWSMTLAAALLLAPVLGGTGGPAIVRAQTSPNHDLSWHIVAGGGPRMASAAHIVQNTVGQFAIGPGASTHPLGSGYRYGIPRAAEFYRIYVPLVMRDG